MAESNVVDYETRVKSLFEGVSNLTTARQVERGMDIQGIPWDTTFYESRETFRQRSLNHPSLQIDVDEMLLLREARQKCQSTVTGGRYYEYFLYNNCLLPTERQAWRNSGYAGMIWSTEKDLFFSTKYKIGRWRRLSNSSTQIMDLEGHVVPSEVNDNAYCTTSIEDGSHMQGFTKTECEAMAVKHSLLIVGGPAGEIICKCIDTSKVEFCFQPGIQERISAVEIYKRQSSGAIHFIATDRGGMVRDFDASTFQFSSFRVPWPVNHASSSMDGRQMLIVGEDLGVRLIDSETLQTTHSFYGHFDYSCSSAWHPHGFMFATGSKDRTCHIWDVRKLAGSVFTLRGKSGPISSICFASDGTFMTMSEAHDLVHVYDVRNDFTREQEIDFVGNVSGLALSPDTDSLFSGVSAGTFPSVLWYKRRQD